MHKCADTPPTLAEAFLVVISSTSSSPLLPPSLTPHSTPSSVIPSSSSVMLDRLQTELLLRILKLAAPLDYSPSFYHERCDLLLACSLVSKQLCTVAQPMLPEVYVVTGKEQVEILEADVSGKKGSKVKLLVLDGSYLEENICDLIDVPDLLALCAGTVEVRVREAGEFNLDWLSGNLALRSLALYGELTRLVSTPATTLPSLVELSMCGIWHANAVYEWFSSNTLPQLRALGIALPPHDPPSLSRISHSFLRQLDILNFDFNDKALDLWRPTGVPLPSLVLDFTLHVSHRLLPSRPFDVPHCIRFYGGTASGIAHVETSDSEYPHMMGLFQDLTNLLEQGPVSSGVEYSVILPLQMSDALATSSELQKLAAVLSWTGGEVIREEVGGWTYGSLISPAMWKRARRIRREGAAKEEAAKKAENA